MCNSHWPGAFNLEFRSGGSFLAVCMCCRMPTALCFYLVMCASIFMFLSTFVCLLFRSLSECLFRRQKAHWETPSSNSLYTRVCLHIYQYLLLCVRSSQYTSVCLHQNGCFFLCAPKSKGFLLLVCGYIKMVAFSPVRLNQNVFFYSCAPTSKRVLLLVCAYIKMFSFTRVSLPQNVLFHSCAPTSKCFLLLVCAYIKMCSFTRVLPHEMFSFTRVRLH